MIGLKGHSLLDEEANFISTNNIGGVILFDRNIQTKPGLLKLIENIKKISPAIFVAVDNEGGRVQRLKAPLFNTLPAMKYFGDYGLECSIDKINKFVHTMSEDLKSVGFNLNFAPCLDVLTNQKNEVIGNRSFSSNKDVVSKLGKAFILEFLKQNIIPCAKHFPGHGSTKIDSHVDLPVVTKSLEELASLEFVPFRTVLDIVPMVMTAHIVYSAIDNMPATLSKKTLSILRSWGYDKVIISDDLDMGALSENFQTSEIPILAINAGCDMLLYCNKLMSAKTGFESVKNEILSGRIKKDTIHRSLDKINILKKRL